MHTEPLTKDNFFDMFGNQAIEELTPVENNGFSRELTDGNIFENKEVPVEVKTEIPVEGEKAEELIPDEEGIFISEEDKKKLGRKSKYNFEDASGYFEDRVKAGKFVAIEETDDKGNKKTFIPKTPEEFDEFIDIQLREQFSQKEKDVEQTWYSSKSPAWQAVAQYAEKVSHPSEMLPFIQSVQNIDDLSEVDATQIEGAEAIYRTWLTKRGEPSDTIEEQISLAKSSDKLLLFGEKYKPILIQQEQQRLQQIDQDRDVLNQKTYQLISEYEQAAIQAIESPIFGKQKLKEDEKALVYDLIAFPKKDIGGYGIYSVIDKLFETKNFEALKKIALIASKEEAFLDYASKNTASKVAQGLQRTLSIATQNASTQVEEEPQANTNIRTVSRNTNTNNFGFRR